MCRCDRPRDPDDGAPRPGLDDRLLREHQVIRIYDIVFDYENLLGTDRFYRTLCRGEAFQKTMGTAELKLVTLR